jgi:hypothetical protein
MTGSGEQAAWKRVLREAAVTPNRSVHSGCVRCDDLIHLFRHAASLHFTIASLEYTGIHNPCMLPASQLWPIFSSTEEISSVANFTCQPILRLNGFLSNDRNSRDYSLPNYQIFGGRLQFTAPPARSDHRMNACLRYPSIIACNEQVFAMCGAAAIARCFMLSQSRHTVSIAAARLATNGSF